MSIWDNVGLQSGGDYVKFEKVGDSIAGVVQQVRAHTWDDGSVSPQITLATDDGEERTVTAGQVRLKAALAEQRPEVGDRLTIRLTDIEKRAMGKTLKHFSVEVERGGEAKATPAASTGGQKVDPAAAAAALANLSPEERATLGL